MVCGLSVVAAAACCVIFFWVAMGLCCSKRQTAKEKEKRAQQCALVTHPPTHAHNWYIYMFLDLVADATTETGVLTPAATLTPSRTLLARPMPLGGCSAWMGRPYLMPKYRRSRRSRRSLRSEIEES